MAIQETPKEAAEPIEVVGGERALSFEDLEQLENDGDRSKEVDTRIEEAKEAVQKDSKKDDEPKEEVEEKVEAKEDDGDKGEETSTEGEEEAELIESYVGEDKTDLRADAKLKVKVNGEDREVTLKDLRDNYSGETRFKEKFDDLNTRTQKFERDKDTLQTFVNEIHENFIVNKDTIGGLWAIVEAMGGDPVEQISKVQEDLLTMAEKMSDMSEDERTQFKQAEKMQLYKRQNDRLLNSKHASKEQAGMQKEVDGVMEKYGMDGPAFHSAYQELAAKLPAEELSPEKVGEHYQTTLAQSNAKELVSGVNPTLQGEELQDAVVEMTEVIKSNENLTPEQIKDIAVRVYGSDASKNLSKKLAKAKPTNTARPSKVQQDDPVTFDDIL